MEMENLSKKLKILGVIFLIISAIGFLDALYLTVEHYSGNVPPCSIEGCEIVLTSTYATVGGIVPVSLLGVLYYGTILFLAIAFLDRKNPRLLHRAALLSPIGFIVSLFLVYLQLFVIKNICLYCMVSAGTSTGLFLIGIYYFYFARSSSRI